MQNLKEAYTYWIEKGKI